MISIKKVSRANVREIEQLFDGAVDFVLDDNGRVVEVIVFKEGMARCLNIRYENFGLVVDLANHAQSGPSYRIDNFPRVEKLIEDKFKGLTFVNDFLFYTDIENLTDAQIIDKYFVFHSCRAPMSRVEA